MDDLKISEIQIIPVKPKDGLLAFVSFIINDCLYVGDVALYSSFGEKEYRLVYPSKILPNSKEINCIHPITKEAGDKIYTEIMKAFKELISRHENQ